MLEQLEETALTQARECCDILQIGGKNVTAEEFDAFSDWDKEAVIGAMARAGLSSIYADIGAFTITVRFSHLIARVMACTIFDVLNRLEKIDGGFSLLGEKKWTMVMEVPIGGKKGLFQWEMLILKMHPWISSVKETSTNETAAVPGSQIDKAPAAPAATNVPAAKEPAANEPAAKEPQETVKKSSFFKRLFGKDY